MPEKIDPQAKTERVEVKLRKRDAEDLASDQETALVLAATQFKALGDPTRLRIINFLNSIEMAAASDSESEAAVQETGRTVGDVSAGVFGKTKVSSTLSHHLKELRNAGLIAMKRRGKNLICRLQMDAIESLRSYLPADSLIIPVTTKAQSTAPRVETPGVPKDKMTRASKTAAAVPAAAPPPQVRTRVRKSSASVRKNKLAEGGTPLDPATQFDELGGV